MTQAGTINPFAVLRTRQYAVLLVFAAILGVPIALVAAGFLWLVNQVQQWVYEDLPTGLGFAGVPVWWPLAPLAVAGLLVGVIIRYFPGAGGHSPADGFHAGTAPTGSELPGVFLAALASLGLGAVIGPEAPLIALGGGLSVLIVRLVKKDAPQQAIMVIGAAGSFAAISALLGSPLLGAFLLMEAIGLSGAIGTVVLMPGLLASGIGALVFIGVDSLVGLGAVSLAIPGLPPFDAPDGVDFLWAIGIGVAAALIGTLIRRLGLLVRPILARNLLLLTPLAGIAVAGLAILYSQVTGKPTGDVLFSGESDLPVLVANHADYAWGALALLLVCKGLGYGISLGGFRGGPVFPSMFLGATIGLLISDLAGVPLVPAVAMGIGALCACMLRLPLTSVLLATLLLGSDGLSVMPLVIVAVVVSYMVTMWVSPPPQTAAGPTPGPTAEPTPPGSAAPSTPSTAHPA